MSDPTPEQTTEEAGTEVNLEYAGVGTAHLSVGVSETEDGEPYVIHGVAIGPDDVTVGSSLTRKVWPASELEQAAETLEGKPLVKNHENTAEGRIGTVTKAAYAPGVGVIYEAEIAPHYDEFAQDIEAGILDVSPRAYHDDPVLLSEDEETGALVVENVLFDNLSVVDQGAAPSNSAFSGPSVALSPDSTPEVVASARIGDTSEAVAVLSRAVDAPDSASVAELLSGETRTEAEPVGESETDSEPETVDLDTDTPDPASDEQTTDPEPTPESEQSASETDAESEPVEHDDPATADTEASSSGSPSAPLAELTATYSPTMEIQYDTASDDAIEEMSEPVVTERSELETLREKASRADEVDGQLEELNSSIEEMASHQKTLETVDDELVEELTEGDSPMVVETEAHEELEALVEEVGSMYAEALAEHSPFSVEELMDRFSPTELRDKVNEHAEAELSAEIEAEPEPEAGTVEAEELSETQESVEEAETEELAREQVAQHYDQMGWTGQAEKVRSGELSLEELGVSYDA